MANTRIKAALLALSASGLIGIAVHEGYQQVAAPPVQGDVPTVGFGHTAQVRAGDTTTPVRALIALHGDVSATERGLHACLGDVALTQNEWDAYVALAFNVGADKVCRSTLARLLHQDPPDYTGACQQILRWTFFQGKNCADPAHRRLCGGLLTRRQSEYQRCMTP